VSILHIESFDNCRDERLLAQSDRGAVTIFLAVNVYAEELECRAQIRDLVFFSKPGLHFDQSFGSTFHVQY
jgi:hypothetical protein